MWEHACDIYEQEIFILYFQQSDNGGIAKKQIIRFL